MLVEAKQILLYSIVEGNPTNRSSRKKEKRLLALHTGSIGLLTPLARHAHFATDKNLPLIPVGSALTTIARQATNTFSAQLQLCGQQWNNVAANLQKETASKMGTK
jgi:hypothetical protein